MRFPAAASGRLTDLQFDGPEGALDAGADFDVGLLVIAETGGGDFEGLGGGGEAGEGEEAGFIGSDGALEAGAVIGSGDFDAGDDGAGGVLDGG